MSNMAQKILRILLFPVSILYGMIMDMRNFLFDIGLLKTKAFPVPVISIGNISAGGSGKTPLTIYLAEKLIKRYESVAVISRGYGRESSGFQLVSDGNTIFLSSQEAGDEPVLIAKRVPGVIVAVAEKRAEGLKLILEKFSPRVILLDDAFQHRYVKRDADIVLVNQQNKHWPLPIPSGRLREFRHNLRRAQIILATNVDEKTASFLPNGVDYAISSKLSELIDRNGKVAGNISHLNGKKVFAYAGIAYPQLFYENLRNNGIEIVSFKNFKDHHFYNITDYRIISDAAHQAKCSFVLCTEKDLIKLDRIQWDILPFRERNQQVLAVSLKLKIYREQELLQKIYGFIDIKKGML